MFKKLNEMAAANPAVTPLVAVGVGLYAYHHGFLNFVFSTPSSAGLASGKQYSVSDKPADAAKT